MQIKRALALLDSAARPMTETDPLK